MPVIAKFKSTQELEDFKIKIGFENDPAGITIIIEENTVIIEDYSLDYINELLDERHHGYGSRGRDDRDYDRRDRDRGYRDRDRGYGRDRYDSRREDSYHVLSGGIIRNIKLDVCVIIPDRTNRDIVGYGDIEQVKALIATYADYVKANILNKSITMVQRITGR